MNLTTGCIKKAQALEIARSVFGDKVNDELLLLILWHKSNYPRERDENRLREDLQAWATESEKAVSDE